MEAFIKAENLKHLFERRDEDDRIVEEIRALDGIDLTVEAGQFIAVMGANGSGKSTFARHLNALLAPTEGTLFVDGKNAGDESVVWEIRKAAGMIFQNPDNQIVAGVVEEDVAFGPENLGTPTEEIRTRVEDSLRAVDMEEYRRHSPDNLSGGQKQRVAVAGILAMDPRCIVMDEPTAMLDPAGRREVMETAHRLNREEGVTIILVTHFMDEAAQADYIYLLGEGKVVASGTPRELFSKEDVLREYGMELPQMSRLANALIRDGLPLAPGILTRGELVDALIPCLGKKSVTGTAPVQPEEHSSGGKREKLCLEHVSYTYTARTSYASKALRDVSLTIREGEVLGLIGHTGSGKSTLIRMFDGLLKPDEGKVYYEGHDIHAHDSREAGISMRRLRGEVGLVFQFAENQLFETTVLKDVAYGPKNMGVDESEAAERAKSVLRMVGLNESCWERSPFELSGGQQRRAAIAGVLAMHPSVLVLDEPTAGLDPRGRDELFDIIRSLRGEMDITVILVSHDMAEVADLAGRIVVLKDGQILLDGTPAEVFSHIRELEEASLAVPEVTYLMEDLRSKGFPVSVTVTTLDEAEREIGRLC